MGNPFLSAGAVVGGTLASNNEPCSECKHPRGQHVFEDGVGLLCDHDGCECILKVSGYGESDK